MKLARSDLEALADAVAPAAGLTIDPASRQRVVDSLEMAAAAARLVMDFPLDDATCEAAAVFHASLRG